MEPAAVIYQRPKARLIGEGLFVDAGSRGDGDRADRCSPARIAEKIKVSVMLVCGTLDRNVAIEQSLSIAKSLKAARVPHELVTFDYLGNALVLLRH